MKSILMIGGIFSAAGLGHIWDVAVGIWIARNLRIVLSATDAQIWMLGFLIAFGFGLVIWLSMKIGETEGEIL